MSGVTFHSSFSVFSDFLRGLNSWTVQKPITVHFLQGKWDGEENGYEFLLSTLIHNPDNYCENDGFINI